MDMDTRVGIAEGQGWVDMKEDIGGIHGNGKIQ